MPLIDFILNLAGLLLWLNWLSRKLDPMARATPATLIGTLRKADAPSHKSRKLRAFLIGLKLPAALLLLLIVRANIYHVIGAAINWSPRLELGPIAISFRSDSGQNTLIFSFLSFLVALGVFYFWLLLLSIANQKVSDQDPLQKLVRLHLRWVEAWPRAIKILLPFVIVTLFWLALYPVLSRLAIIPPVKSIAHLFEEAIVIGLGSYLSWKYLLIGILLLHLLNSYVYLGNHPFWSFVNTTADNFLAPLHGLPLCVGRVDLSPIVGVAIVSLLAQFGTHGIHLFKSFGIPGLTQLYQKLPL
jgi:uncharacterized protein YggT (Ycf19 family)